MASLMAVNKSSSDQSGNSSFAVASLADAGDDDDDDDDFESSAALLLFTLALGCCWLVRPRVPRPPPRVLLALVDMAVGEEKQGCRKLAEKQEKTRAPFDFSSAAVALRKQGADTCH